MTVQAAPFGDTNFSGVSRLSLDRHKVFIFPTRHGFVLAVLLFAVLLGSINYDNALGYMLTFLLTNLFLITILSTYRNLTKLCFINVDVPSVFVGQEVRCRVTIHNPSSERRYALQLGEWPKRSLRARLRQRKNSQTNLAITKIDLIEGHQNAIAEIRFSAEQRGWISVDRILLRSTFPLGIIQAWAYFESGAQCLVYPRPDGHRQLPRQIDENDSGFFGEAIGDDDFAGMKPYVAGDPIRAISWKRYARDDALMINRFTGSGSDQHIFSWADTDHCGDIESRLSQLTLWVCIAATRGAAYGLSLPDCDVALDNGENHRARCLRTLALYGKSNPSASRDRIKVGD